MKDIISFDVKLTPNQKKAQDKLNQVHQLYDEIEKLLGTQDVFKRPHLFMELPKKEPQTNEEWLRSCNTEQLADKLTDFSFWLVPTIPTEDKREQIRKKIELWLKEKHNGV